MPVTNKIPDLPKTINDIAYMRTTGMRSKFSIAEYLMNTYSVSKQYAYRVIGMMETELAEHYKDDAINHLANTIARFEALAELAMMDGNINAAIKAEDYIAKLKGLYTIKIESTSNVDLQLFPDIEYDNEGNRIDV